MTAPARRARVVVASDRAAAGAYADRSGPVLRDGLRALGMDADVVVVADGDPVGDAVRAAVADGVDVVVTSGGTGVHPADRTPEVTAPLLERQLPGVAEALRRRAADRVPGAALSRGVAGVAGRTLVVNVPGSPAAARDALAVLAPLLHHALDQLDGGDHTAAADDDHPNGTNGSHTAAGRCHPRGTDDSHTAAGFCHPRARDASHAAAERCHLSRTDGSRADAESGAAVACGAVAERAAVPWDEARSVAYAAGAAWHVPAVTVPVADAVGSVLAAPLPARTPLPPCDTSGVDGYAVRGPGPWRVVARVDAGARPAPLAEDGTAAQVATGATLPPGTAAVLRTEWTTTTPDGRIGAAPPVGRSTPGAPSPPHRHAGTDRRPAGEEAAAGEELVPAGAVVSAAVAGLAAAAGHDALRVRPAPRVALRIFGDELRRAGLPGDGRVRDALGPALPHLLRQLGGAVAAPPDPLPDTPEAHVAALREALAQAPVVCTTGGTMRGPADHLHAALALLDAEYLVSTVAVRPGYPMLLARVGDGFVVGLPGNPQSAVVAALTLTGPLLAGLTGRPLPPPDRVRLAAPVAGAGPDTRLALVRLAGSRAHPVPHAGSAMLRGLAGADGWAVVPPGASGGAGCKVDFLPLPPTAPAASATLPVWLAVPEAGGVPAVATGVGAPRPAGAPPTTHDQARTPAGARARVHAAVTTAPLDPQAHEQAVRGAAAGAVAAFHGVVRDHDDGRAVRALTYEAHPDAGTVLAGLAAEVADDPQVHAVAVSHRVGALAVGDVALSVAVSSAHRKTAFTACAELVEQVKQRLPVWKLQHFADGTDAWTGCP